MSLSIPFPELRRGEGVGYTNLTHRVLLIRIVNWSRCQRIIFDFASTGLFLISRQQPGVRGAAQEFKPRLDVLRMHAKAKARGSTGHRSLQQQKQGDFYEGLSRSRLRARL